MPSAEHPPATGTVLGFPRSLCCVHLVPLSVGISQATLYKEQSYGPTPGCSMSLTFALHHVLFSWHIFKNSLFETRLLEWDVYSVGTQSSAGLFTDALLGLKRVRTGVLNRNLFGEWTGIVTDFREMKAASISILLGWEVSLITTLMNHVRLFTDRKSVASDGDNFGNLTLTIELFSISCAWFFKHLN